MTQVLLNLVNNALKYTQREGKIRIIIEKVSDREGRLTHIKFQILDNGIGIKDEDKPKLFKLFGML
jgi:signal transduction histidine kinase